MLASLLMFFIVGVISIIALTVVFAVIGGLLSLAGLLLFKVAPLLLLGWIAVRLFQRCRPRSRISAADRAWLDD